MVDFGGDSWGERRGRLDGGRNREDMGLLPILFNLAIEVVGFYSADEAKLD